MKLTLRQLLNGASQHGGFSASQMDILGVPRPLVSGWKTSVVGQEISEETYARFLAAKDATHRVLKQRKREQEAQENPSLL